MKYLILLSSLLAFNACSEKGGDSSESKPCAQDESTDCTSIQDAKKIIFEGYVQTAFEVSVDDVEFNDTEHFYTRFKTDLIEPNYPELKDKEIKILGEYGHNKFGTRSPVYISPMVDDGHQFYGVTDEHRHFSVNVGKASADKAFRAKIINRIGLEIEGKTFCYILQSTKNDIRFSDNKPIIFDTFKTQLNEWQCEIAPEPEDVPAMNSGNDETPGSSDAGKLPNNNNATNSPNGKIVLGVTKADAVRAILGEPTFIDAEDRTLYRYWGGSGVCEDTSAECGILFDHETIKDNTGGSKNVIDKIIGAQNIKHSLIKRPNPSKKISLGMTKAEVINILGLPSEELGQNIYSYDINLGYCKQSLQGMSLKSPYVNGTYRTPQSYCSISFSSNEVSSIGSIYSPFIQ